MKRNQHADACVVRTVNTRLGTFELRASSKGLYRIGFPGERIDQERAGQGAAREARKHLNRAASAMKAYARGRRAPLRSLKIDFSGYSPFEKKVLCELRRVTRGSTQSYGELAARVNRPRAARAVGSVMRKNRTPIVLPCHRIVPVSGRLGQYALGKHWKSRLLKLEGASVRG